MPVTKGEPDKKDRKRVNELWGRYETYRSGHVSGVRYALGADAFTDWNAPSTTPIAAISTRPAYKPTAAAPTASAS
ncbi:hypothetical protein [Azomonas macrocytogenes]|uniref:Uncharacterized protein n=1 Tax=Azomonas macrocytogenes TaxID=69962 RepID=A0A839T7J1_AZOMA|nr:hypothetical protein [Azomonas macrocytogenes]MBB3104224.1 hypothetical protein [Azomonas macrocytogenes]